MSFRKRNVGLTGPTQNRNQSPFNLSPNPAREVSNTPGTRPSPLDGRPVTSTGTQSLDNLLGGHAGLALGNSILIEESGTTDFAGALLRYYAAEGILQGHKVHVVGVGEHWGRELPGVVPQTTEQAKDDIRNEDKGQMKIAWRYESQGEFGAGPLSSRPSPIPDRSIPAPNVSEDASIPPSIFCHSFDLTKRLPISSSNPINFLPLLPVDPKTSPFTTITLNLIQKLASSPPNTIHRLIIPTILSPAFYPTHASSPQHILQFLHSLRALLRQYPSKLTAMLTLPLLLFSRSTGLVRWMEILSDGVLELAPFPHTYDAGPSVTTSGASTAQEEKPQGMVKVHRLPVFHEKGGAGGVGGDDLAFTVSRRKFAIQPFSLPPVDGDSDAQRGEVGSTKVDIEF